jgi:hypothetical protein
MAPIKGCKLGFLSYLRTFSICVGYIPLIYGIIVKAAFKYMWNAVFIGYPSICLWRTTTTTASITLDGDCVGNGENMTLK